MQNICSSFILPLSFTSVKRNILTMTNKSLKIFILAIFFLVLMFWAGKAVIRPFIIAHEINTENNRLQSKILAEEKANQELRKNVAAMSSSQGIEREARRLGYLRKGEVALVIPH